MRASTGVLAGLVVGCASPSPSSSIGAGAREKAATEWVPGDPVPGWDDYDCGEPAGGPVFTVEFPSVVRMNPVMGASDGSVGFNTLLVDVGGCLERIGGSVEEGVCEFPDNYISGELDSIPEPVEQRGLGWFPDPEHEHRYAGSSGAFPVGGYWIIKNGHELLEVSGCISRLRPDEVSGVFDFVVTPNSWGGMGYFLEYYDQVTVRVPFRYVFPPHAGLYDTGGGRCTLDTSDWHGVISYFGPYDDTWPWSDITDSEVRDVLYETYTPCNSP